MTSTFTITAMWFPKILFAFLAFVFAGVAGMAFHSGMDNGWEFGRHVVPFVLFSALAVILMALIAWVQ
jgi:hypothetical protein